MNARRAAEAIAAIESAFASAEGLAYLGEDVTMTEHQLQAGALAVAAGAPDTLVVAALLHDVGHLRGQVAGGVDASAALEAEIDAHHDVSGARWLGHWFGAEVTEPVRLHVAAKRYLVAVEPEHASRLSAASVRTLRLQGGAMTLTQVVEFEAASHWRDAVALRRFDEAAKDAAAVVPGIDAYRDVIRRVLDTTR
jgi:gamma-butyrobetaine dioxygenase